MFTISRFIGPNSLQLEASLFQTGPSVIFFKFHLSLQSFVKETFFIFFNFLSFLAISRLSEATQIFCAKPDYHSSSNKIEIHKTRVSGSVKKYNLF